MLEIKQYPSISREKAREGRNKRKVKFNSGELNVKLHKLNQKYFEEIWILKLQNTLLLRVVFCG